MKNQDPFNPTDNTQMIAQMAQFSSVAGIAEMNTTMQAIAAKLNGTSAADAIAYVGKTVLTPGTVAYPRSTGGIAGAIELPSDTTATGVTIADATGEVVAQLDLGGQKAGTVSYDWDGKDAAGNPVDTGPFTVTVGASNGGTAVAAQNLVWAPVESVALTGGEPVLNIPGLGRVTIPAVRQVG
jgi:flagellar basal-body rod modification protein FlgD